MTRIQKYLFLALITLVLTPAQAFIVDEIKVEGNKRIKSETILSYLSFEVGSNLDAQGQKVLLRDLYQSDLFTDVKLQRDGGQLFVVVEERPAIASIEFDGNVLLKTKDIEDALDQVGLIKGRIYNKNVLAKLELELERIYYSQGKYGVKVATNVKPLEDNRVAIDIEIAEGFPAKVVQINIVGNQAFDDETLEEELKTGIPSWWAIFSSRDKYSKPKLQGDLEALKSWYLDRGYMKFSIASTQVTISPDKKDLYVNINIDEGDLFTVKESVLAGKLVIDEAEMKQLIFIQDGEAFSRKKIQQVTTLIKQRLGKEGYARVKVNVIPEVDEAAKEVVLGFNVDPGKRYNVRNIRFQGNADTFDEVLRREMRQMEGAWYDSTKIERGRVRLQRLSYVAEVDTDLIDVAGTDDQVDLVYKVEERLSGSINLGAGFSEADGVLFNFGISKDNLFGTGNSLSFKLDRSSVTKSASVSYTNPYYTIDGVSRGFNLFYRETDASETDASDYILNVLGGGVSYGIPLSEYSRLTFGLTVEVAELIDTLGSPDEVKSFLYSPTSTGTAQSPDCREAGLVGTDGVTLLNPTAVTCASGGGEKYTTLSPSIGYIYDTRNRTVFAEKGVRHSVSLEASLPGSDLELYKTSYSAEYYTPVMQNSVLLFKHALSYGDGYGKGLKELPPYEKFTAGGIRSLRGFRARTLTSDAGTIDSFNRPYGGDLRVTGSLEYILPPPGNNNNMRFGLFYDFGNVFSDINKFDSAELRSSAGISLNWLTPIGALVFSYAEPQQTESIDNIQRFQFTIGGSF